MKKDNMDIVLTSKMKELTSLVNEAARFTRNEDGLRPNEAKSPQLLIILISISSLA